MGTSPTFPSSSIKAQENISSQSMRVQFEPETGIQTQADVMNASNIKDYDTNVDSSQFNDVNEDNFGSSGVPIPALLNSISKGDAYDEQRPKDEEATKTSNSVDSSYMNGVARQTFPSFGISPTEMKVKPENDDRPKKSLSPYDRGMKSSPSMGSRSSFGNPISTSSGKKDYLNKPKRSISPFRNATKPTSPMGSSDSFDTSTKTTSTENKFQNKSKQSFSPFGVSLVKSSDSFGTSTNMTSTEDEFQNKSKQSFSPFRSMGISKSSSTTGLNEISRERSDEKTGSGAPPETVATPSKKSQQQSKQ